MGCAPEIAVLAHFTSGGHRPSLAPVPASSSKYALRLGLCRYPRRRFNGDGQPVELQQLASAAPDEERGEALRLRHRTHPTTGEYRPANRYARVLSSRDALRLLAHASDQFQHQGLYILANRLKKAVADKAKTGAWISFAKDSGTTDKDIAARVVVMLDLDPRREDDVKDISATAEEREHALERALDERQAQARAGGRARNRNLTDDEKSKIARAGAAARWAKWRELHRVD